LFNVLLSVVKEKLSPDELNDVLREVGRRIAADTATNGKDDTDISTKAQKAADVLESLGGAARVETENSRIKIESESCPFASAVEAHPEVCSAAETLVAEITGERVRERCDKSSAPPHCSFEITEKKRRA
jgi:predicted ArsR family transcriptional regulator